MSRSSAWTCQGQSTRAGHSQRLAIEPDHVFGVLAAAFIAHAGLRHHEGLKPLLAKLGQHRGGGDVGVPLRTAFVRGIREDGRGYVMNLVIGQRVITA